jgi:hypothetical protein
VITVMGRRPVGILLVGAMIVVCVPVRSATVRHLCDSVVTVPVARMVDEHVRGLPDTRREDERSNKQRE